MALVMLWGTSFMFTSISVETVDPLSVVFFRVLIAAVILTGVVYFRGQQLPFKGKDWLSFAVMSVFGNALPFFLISWGQQWVDSGIAGMIMAIMPLMTLTTWSIPRCNHTRKPTIASISVPPTVALRTFSLRSGVATRQK